MSVVFKRKNNNNIGSFIKSLEKETEWVFMIDNSTNYSIKLQCSEINKSKILKLNEQVILTQNISKEKLHHEFQIQNVPFCITYDKLTKNFVLLASDNDIETFAASASNLSSSLSKKQNSKPPSYIDSSGAAAVYDYNRVESQESSAAAAASKNAYLGQSMNTNLPPGIHDFYAQGNQLQPANQNSQSSQKSIDLGKQKKNSTSDLIQSDVNEANLLVDSLGELIDEFTNQENSKKKEEFVKALQRYEERFQSVLGTDLGEHLCDQVLKTLNKVQDTIQFVGSLKKSVPNKQQQEKKQKRDIDEMSDDEFKKSMQEELLNQIYPPLESEMRAQKQQLAPEVKQQSLVQPLPKPAYYQESDRRQQQRQDVQQQEQKQFVQKELEADEKSLTNSELSRAPTLPPLQQKKYPKVNVGNNNLNNDDDDDGCDNNNDFDEEVIMEKPKLISELSDDHKCIICLDMKSSHTLIPCGHKKYCGGCAEEMVKKGQCAFCRNPTTQALRIYE